MNRIYVDLQYFKPRKSYRGKSTVVRGAGKSQSSEKSYWRESVRECFFFQGEMSETRKLLINFLTYNRLVLAEFFPQPA